MKKFVVLLLTFLCLGIGIYFRNYYYDLKEDNDINVPNKNNTNEPQEKIVKLTLIGDLLFESPFYKSIELGDDKDIYFSKILKYFKNDDISLGNMEVVIGNDELKVSGDGYNFCAPEYVGDLVSNVDFEVLTLANNHSYDRGLKGIYSTIDYFNKNSDIKTVGVYKNIDDRKNIITLNKNGIKLAFLGYTYGTNQKPNENDKDLIGYFKDPYTKLWSEEYKQKIKDEIIEAKKVSDILVVFMHWGNEFTYKPTKEQQEVASFLNKLGVDIIVGSHSHCIQPIEIIGEEQKTLVYYSLGNFVSHDNDIARTPIGEEEFDNSYQFGLLSTIELKYDNNKLNFNNISTEIIVNYFDKNMRNFQLIPFNEYNEEYETKHYRYNYGLTKEFIKNTYENVINKEYR